MEAQSQSSPTETPPPPRLLGLKETGTLLIKHFDLHEGLFDVTFEIQVAIGQFGAGLDSSLPGGAFLIRSVGLQAAPVVGPNTLDAAEVNPDAVAKPVTKAAAKKRAAK